MGDVCILYMVSKKDLLLLYYYGAIHPQKTHGRLQSKSQLSQQMEEKEQKSLAESGDRNRFVF